jgi:hypothetical protein
VWTRWNGLLAVGQEPTRGSLSTGILSLGKDIRFGESMSFTESHNFQRKISKPLLASSLFQMSTEERLHFGRRFLCAISGKESMPS